MRAHLKVVHDAAVVVQNLEMVVAEVRLNVMNAMAIVLEGDLEAHLAYHWRTHPQ